MDSPVKEEKVKEIEVTNVDDSLRFEKREYQKEQVDDMMF